MTRNRLNNVVLAGVAMLASVAVVGATTPPPQAGDQALASKIRKEIALYPRYTIWDNVTIHVHDGHVKLDGQVSQPFKKNDMGRLAQHVPGVASVTNSLEVLPLSRFDDQIRIQVARAIYRDPVLSRYGIQANPPIHVIVKNGHITLEGVVSTAMEKQVAGLRAASAPASFGPVVNNLRVENGRRKS
jgi:osmotically-inducible protein OsmY